jgi:glycogen debranching enzyme
MPQVGKAHLRESGIAIFLALLALSTHSSRLAAQARDDTDAFSRLRWTTDSTGPRRFISVHGRRAAVFGYSEDYAGDGLEVWAYPVQILSSYRVTFRQVGTTTAIDGESLLRRVVYSPEAVTRVYAGPDFIVHERIFVPLDEPGAVIRYDVESAHPLDIEIRFVPILDLMWPASTGGQEAVWNSAASAYLFSEPTHRYTARVGSPDIVAHDETPNDGQHIGRARGLAFTIRADRDQNRARVYIAGSVAGEDASSTAKRLLEAGARLEKSATDHYSDLLSHALQVETPDAEVNRALVWSEIALDQAWVCNPDLGCGLVAGYGPSRKARRPQYDWFFAGDGMVAIRALLAAGEFERVRQELEFILKYQDQKTGMIWHELSQSAGRLDWSKYPYLFVHVDLTFDFLNTVGDYFSVTGDRDFVKTHWPSIQSAYEYCRSLLDSKDGLPRIPANKEGGREQDALTDELALSASWAAAAQAFSDLASATGHDAAAKDGQTAGQRARRAIVPRYWDDRQHFWITGYTRSGAPLLDRGIGPFSIRGAALLPEVERNSLLDQFASSDYQADWGTRGRAFGTSAYDPNSYASGSVWATGTAGMATAFWAEHRPATALPIWSSLVPWSSLDSLGHMHETLAGDDYHEERESVPEQTWSSAAFFAAAVNGLLGLQLDSGSNRLTFAPHLPPTWNTITLRNLRVGASEITMNVFQSDSGIQLKLQNGGPPVEVVFDPEIPFGAKLGSAHLESRPVNATLTEHLQDTHARVEFNLPHGSASLTMDYRGGVRMIDRPPQLMVGESSKAIKITGMSLKDRAYTVDFDFLPSAVSSFELRTPWTIKDAEGATFEVVSPGLYRFTINAPIDRKAKEPLAYEHGKVIVIFASDKI